MGVHERQERERAARRRAILDAARQLFVSDGLGNVTMRRIADSVEYSASAIYGYFESQEQIFLELAEEGFRLLIDAPLDGPPPTEPLDTLRQAYWQYYAFGRRYPEYFALMFLERSLPTVRDQEQFAFLKDQQEHGPRLVRACIEAGDMPTSVDAEAAARVLWAAVHGPAVIRVTWPAAAAAADILADNVLNAVLAGLRAGVVLAPIPEPRPPHEEAPLLVGASEEAL